jgi:hypothetical protein
VSRIEELEEKLRIIGIRERCLELTQELATVKERAEAAEARAEELEQEIKDLRRGFLYLCRDDQVETLWGERPEDIMELCIEQSIDDPKNKRSRT